MQLLFQSLQWFEVSHAFTHRWETFCLQAMQLLLQTVLSVEDAHEKAHCKKECMNKQECSLILCIILIPGCVILLVFKLLWPNEIYMYFNRKCDFTEPPIDVSIVMSTQLKMHMKKQWQKIKRSRKMFCLIFFSRYIILMLDSRVFIFKIWWTHWIKSRKWPTFLALFWKYSASHDLEPPHICFRA